MDPWWGGAMGTGSDRPSAQSALLSTGVLLVRHRSLETKVETSAITIACGEMASSTKHDSPSAFTPVTSRRIVRTLSAGAVPASEIGMFSGIWFLSSSRDRGARRPGARAPRAAGCRQFSVTSAGSRPYSPRSNNWVELPLQIFCSAVGSSVIDSA